MKLKFVISVLLAMFAFSCSDDDGNSYKCSDCVSVPEANAAYDNTGQGIYKGVVIGSSGTIKFDIANSDNTLTAVLIIDGQEVLLTATGSYSPTTGFSGAFTGTLNGQDASIVFTVSTAGGFQLITVNIPGHPDIMFTVMKERSTQLVEAFEGTYQGQATGTFNLLVLRDEDDNGEWYAISRSTELDGYYEGTIDDDDLVGLGGSIIVVGEIEGHSVKGSWENTTGGTGTWTGKRTL
ncbi:MAG TPA: hypothetical protein VGK39_05270 [Cyclobacteriaceae bacterium]